MLARWWRHWWRRVTTRYVGRMVMPPENAGHACQSENTHRGGLFFFGLRNGNMTACVERITKWFPQMATMPVADTHDDPTAEPPKKKRREAPSKPCPPARPYKRLEKEVLEWRLKELNKKLAVLRSKVVLLEDRLEGHDNEAALRKTEMSA